MLDRPGLLLIGHGTRDAEGTAAFLELARLVSAARPDIAVQPCFLELAQPDIPTGLADLVAQGVRPVTAVPLLLLAAGHAKRDIPQWLSQAAAAHRGLEWRLTGHLGCHPAVLDLSAQRFREALAEAEPTPADETLLLFVGRGSTDPEANAEMAQFCRLRWEQTPVGWYEICFTALAEPSLDRALEVVQRLPFRRVVVQPHLLFPGRLLDRVAAAVDQRRQIAGGGHQWLVTPPLGAASKLVEAVLDLAGLTAT